MNRVSISLTPVDRVAAKHINTPEALIPADATPSRNPCKVRTAEEDAAEYRNEPYRFRAVRHSGLLMAALQAPEAPVPQPSTAQTASADVGGLGLRLHSGLTGLGLGSLGASAGGSGPLSVAPLNHTENGLPPLKVPTPPRDSAAQVDSTATAAEGEGQITAARPPLPPTGRAKHARRHIAVVVQFKYVDGVYELPDYDPATESYIVGDWVVVEAERGEHLGRITQCNLIHRHKVAEVGRVVRRATAEDLATMEEMRSREFQAALQCQAAADQHGVPMRIFDTEIQHDFRKVTIYYVPMVFGLVDFRLLQRYLFRLFQCRIWFANVNSFPLTVPVI